MTALGTEKASDRWNILRQAIIKKSRGGGQSKKKSSMLEFTSFDLLTVNKVIDDDGGVWHLYQYQPVEPFRARVKHIPTVFNPEELMGFNNTGNVCVWPAEEVLTYWCLENRHLFKQQKICELGGGMTCLAGLAVATCCAAEEVLLTDGNELSIKNVQEILKENAEYLKAKTVTASVIRWDKQDEYTHFKETFDYVISADCLFFDQYREDLLTTIGTILKPKGVCIIFAPRRHKTCDKFCAMAKERYQVTLEEKYDAAIWNKHLEAIEKSSDIYDENRHYPLKITLMKS
ncbi:calmodulin-lysine N-methyltransferase-like [Anneissia japonica]|uniref:calmodulin-lysine N-methyltransferase-like n=1 Tax=Anneissia japonica TaxID=1529436 RepID=UPI0014259E01|nr:calmodulin-lysine N-methyltransferase-like [Anneissia japonica]